MRCIKIDPWTWIAVALGILLLPIPWCVAAVSAAAVHECFHIAAVVLCGGTIQSLTVSPFGAVMTAHPLSGSRALICILAGPFGGALLILLAGIFPRLALCGAIQSAFNLLPVYPLDGGKAIRCVSELFLPAIISRRISHICTLCCLSVMAIAGGYIAVRYRFFPLLLLTAILLLQWKKSLANS